MFLLVLQDKQLSQEMEMISQKKEIFGEKMMGRITVGLIDSKETSRQFCHTADMNLKTFFALI